TELDHVRDRQHAGEEAEAGVAYVEVQAVRLEPEVAVHEARDRWLDEVLADGCADQHVDPPAVDLRVGERAVGGARGDGGRLPAWLPESARADSGDGLEVSRCHPEATVERREPLFEVRRRD